jgi:hypothetical protein
MWQLQQSRRSRLAQSLHWSSEAGPEAAEWFVSHITHYSALHTAHYVPHITQVSLLIGYVCKQYLQAALAFAYAYAFAFAFALCLKPALICGG